MIPYCLFFILPKPTHGENYNYSEKNYKITPILDVSSHVIKFSLDFQDFIINQIYLNSDLPIQKFRIQSFQYNQFKLSSPLNRYYKKLYPQFLPEHSDSNHFLLSVKHRKILTENGSYKDLLKVIFYKVFLLGSYNFRQKQHKFFQFYEKSSTTKDISEFFLLRTLVLKILFFYSRFHQIF